jgi:hypothetical protein
MRRDGRGDDPLNARLASRLAWSLWAVAIALVAGGLVFGLANRPEAPLYEYWVEDALISPTFATLGALIVSRRPGNVIGWIFLASSIGGGIQLLSGQYATVALLSDGPSRLPGGAVAGLLSNVAQASLVFPILFLVLLFPTGRLLSPRWRPLAWIGGTALVVAAVSIPFTPGPLEDFERVHNPLVVEAFAGFFDLLAAIGGWMGGVCFGTAIFSLILRFYRSRGDERQQLKWFVYAATLGFLAIVLAGETPIVGELVWTLGPLSLPVAAGIAILKYRLYDIDLVINRTLVYGSLTATLAGVYFGSVVVLQGALRALTGQESQLAVVVSTLAIAALFGPLRRRIQAFIDRRFYRSKYDATQILEAFGAKLRDETDLDQLSTELRAVVRDAMQPAHTSLWLRPPERE